MAALVTAAVQQEGHADGWTDVTIGPLADPGTGYGASWGDYDGDGDHDLCLVQYDYSPQLRLFRNDGGGAFTEATAGPLTAGDPTLTALWGDADNDGDLDLFRVHFFEPRNVLYRNTGGTFTTSSTRFSTKGGVGGASWGDADGDGDLDVVFVSHFGTTMLYYNVGALSFTEGPWLGEAVRPVWIDYDSDGDLDLHRIARNFDELLRNDAGTFVDAVPGVLTDNNERSAGAWGDYDNDGDPDLYLAMVSGSNRLLRNDGSATFTDVTASTPVGLAGDSRDAAWADFDNDGDLDLFVVRSASANVLFRNEGAQGFVSAGSSALDGVGTRRAAAWADYDGDGDLDVYVAGDSTAGRLIRNDLPSGQSHWLQVDLIGVNSNRSGIGARVRVKSGGIWQMRDVSGGEGFSQGSLTCEFGLGASMVVDSLTVRWRSSAVQVLTGIEADQRITIMEGGTTATPDLRDVSDVMLWPVAPNPSWGSIRLRFDLSRDDLVRLEVVDVTGRHVRLLADRSMPAGRHGVSWDGLDANGQAAPAGIYWLRFAAGSFRQSRRLVRLR